MNKNEMVVINGYLRIKEGMEQEFLSKISTYMETVKHREGMLIDSIHLLNDDPRAILVYEQYESAAALQNHIDSPEFQAWAPVRDQLLESREIKKWRLFKSIGSTADE